MNHNFTNGSRILYPEVYFVHGNKQKQLAKQLLIIRKQLFQTFSYIVPGFSMVKFFSCDFTITLLHCSKTSRSVEVKHVALGKPIIAFKHKVLYDNEE